METDWGIRTSTILLASSANSSSETELVFEASTITTCTIWEVIVETIHE